MQSTTIIVEINIIYKLNLRNGKISWIYWFNIFYPEYNKPKATHINDTNININNYGLFLFRMYKIHINLSS